MKSAKSFAALKCSQYKNVNELIATIDDQLHPVETLYGDLQAELLVLGQDSMHWDGFAALYKVHNRGAYCHGDNRTNQAITSALSDYLKKTSIRRGMPSSPKDCGVFYGNAIWLLKDTATMSGPLRNLQQAKKACRPVFTATLDGLPCLKVIWAMGKVSYEFLREVDTGNSLLAEWDSAKTMLQYGNFGGRHLAVFTTEHGSRARTDIVTRVHDRLRESCLM